MTGPEILASVEATLIAADLGFPVHLANQEDGWGYRDGAAVEISTSPDAEWAEVSMPEMVEEQITSGNATALRGNRRPIPLLYVRYFGPTGVEAAVAIGKARSIGKLFAGTKVQDSLGGVEFEAGVSTRLLGVGPSANAVGPFFQVESRVRGLMLFSEAA